MNHIDPKFWNNRKVLVTGASGIVGSCVVNELLMRGAEVGALVLDVNPQTELYRSGSAAQINVINGCLEDFAAVERSIVWFGADTVIHLAAQAIVDVARMSPLSTFEANVRGTWNVLEVCRQHPDLVKRIVVASSDKAYGEHAVLPYTEDMALQGTYPYEVSKSCADLISKSYAVTYNMPIAIARCGNIYGPGDLNWSRIVPGTIRSLYLGERPILRSDGNYIRDYIYVRDVAQAYISLAENLDRDCVRGKGFNFSTESRITVLEIVDAIRRAMNCTHIEPLIKNNATGEIPNQYLSAERAHQVLGWKAEHTLEQGMSETIEWYLRFFQAIGLANPAAALAASAQ